jgi:hypothetical protein
MALERREVPVTLPDVHRPGFARTPVGLDVKIYLLVFGEMPHASLLHGAHVHKQIGAALMRLYKSVPFAV